MQLDPAAVATLSSFGTAVTAVATIVLVGVTGILAVETRRLARMTSNAQVVVSLHANRWALTFADLHIQNTGNATAFDIEVSSDPPLTITDPVDPGEPPPFQNISLLKPGQALETYFGRFPDIMTTTYRVTVSWKRQPTDTKKESLTHTIRVADIRGTSHLGGTDPMIELAQDIHKLQEDFHRLVEGRRKPRIDVFTSADREAERAGWDRQRQEALEARKHEKEAAGAPKQKSRAKRAKAQTGDAP